MKRVAIVVSFTLIYLLAVGFALIYLPGHDTPALLKSLFGTRFRADLAWMKLRHILVVGIVAGFLAALLFRLEYKHALRDGFYVGGLAVLCGLAARLCMIGHGGFGCIELTDYLTVGLAIPCLVVGLRWLEAR